MYHGSEPYELSKRLAFIVRAFVIFDLDSPRQVTGKPLRSPPSRRRFLAAFCNCFIWRVKDFCKFQAIALLTALVRITGLKSYHISTAAPLV